MKISSISFKEPPVYHEIPPIYEGLGLPDLSSFIQQRFEFAYTLGKVERTGHGSIRFYKQQGDFKVTISDNLPGVGPIRLQKLKGLLLEEAKNVLIENIESELEKRKVYYAEFRRPEKIQNECVVPQSGHEMNKSAVPCYRKVPDCGRTSCCLIEENCSDS